MTSNLYKVGDWVFCEVSSYQPYVIRKIEELTKTPNGNVEAKVICAYRHQDIPASVMATVERYQAKSRELEKQEKEKQQKEQNNEANSSDSSSETKQNNTTTTTATTTPATTTTTNTYDFDESEVAELNELQRYNLKHRELYFSKYTDTIAATTIRSKCSVLLFNEEIERYADYLNKEDVFYYHLTYDPYQKSLVADKGEIRVGLRYQAEVPALRVAIEGQQVDDCSSGNEKSQSERTSANDRVLRSQLQKMSNQKDGKEFPEVPISSQNEEDLFQWCPLEQTLFHFRNNLTDQDIDKFLMLAKSVGTYARALDCTSAFKQPSLSLSAASASRDITLFHAMSVLHESNYDIGKAALNLITPMGPVLCKDEMEDWSAIEANLFEDALEKYGKEFGDIKRDFLPWKSMRSIIEYYYQWKTTDRYLQQKRMKLAESESKLKQVYIPNHSKQNQSALIKSSHVTLFNQYDVHLKTSCESCGAPNTSTNQWYVYNPSNLVQLIMSGNTNPNILANAAAQHHQLMLQQQQQANGTTNHHGISQARLCVECWTYWKKFSNFKYPNARHDRNRNQVHKCSVNGCGREFKMKQLLIKHCGIAHGYFAKVNNPATQNNGRQPIRNRTAFYLYTTPMTKAARVACTNTIKLRKLAKRPFKLIELSELNKEWTKETRNITEIVDTRKKTYVKRKLTVKLIDRISKHRSKSLKRKQQNRELNGGTNGHHAVNGHEEDDDEETQLVIDNQDDESKPEYFKYFGQKSLEPSFKPAQIAFPKPAYEQINKFHLNLMSQNRKRAHEQSGPNPSQTNNHTNDSSPQSKRSLLAHNNTTANKLTNGLSKQAHPQPQQNARLGQKYLNKPTQSSNLANTPDDICYSCNTTFKTLRREIETVVLRKLARKPYKLLEKQYDQVYETLAKAIEESLSSKKKHLNGSSEKQNEQSKVNGKDEIKNGDDDQTMSTDSNGDDASSNPATTNGNQKTSELNDAACAVVE